MPRTPSDEYRVRDSRKPSGAGKRTKHREQGETHVTINVWSPAMPNTLESHSLENMNRIVEKADRLAGEEVDAIRKRDPKALPADSPAWHVAYAANREASRVANLQKAAADTVSMRRDELETALSPLVSFKSIMAAAGQSSIDVDAGDVADVMDALLTNTFHRVGVPGVMGI